MSLSSPSLLSANELVLSYGHKPLLRGVTLQVAPGEKVGLVGRNGCGKTSLFKVLVGDEAPDAGDISRRRGLRVGYLPQEFELEKDRTVLENIEAGAADLRQWLARYESAGTAAAEMAELQSKIEAADGWNLQSRITATATALAAPPLDTRVGPLSGGEKRRVALCQALAAQPDLLLLDEPTNHLDSESIRWLEQFLRAFSGAVIFVTHDRYFLDVIATRIIELAEGKCYSHPGNYTAYLESKAIRRQIDEQAERRRQRFLRVELDWVRSGVKARRTKSRHRLDTFYEVKGLEAPGEEREMDLLIPPAPEIGDTAVSLVKAGACVTESGSERWLFRDLTLALEPGTCTGIIGANGVGKTTLLRSCLGERPPDEGKVTMGKKVVFNYIDQSRQQLKGAGSLLDEISAGEDTLLFGDKRISARGYLRRFLFSDERCNEPVDRLSGGERARLLLAKVLRRGGNVLVLDEPTNDLDLPSLRMLEEALANFDGTVLVVSHDRYFLDRICDRMVAFEEQGLIVQPGNFSYYLEKRQERDKQNKTSWAGMATPSTATRRERQPKTERPRKLNFKEKRELAGIEKDIMSAESRVTELETTLNDPEFYVTRAKQAADLGAALEAAKTEVARLYARWEELAQIADATGKGC